MLQLSSIRNNPEEVINRLSIKNFDGKGVINRIIEIDAARRKTQTEMDQVLAHQNSLAKQIGDFYKSGKKEEANDLKNKSGALKEEAKQQQQALHGYENDLHELLITIPNLPSPDVPAGKKPEDNEVVFTSKNIPVLSDNALPHWELTDKYKLIDFELGVKITGAGFPVYKHKGARIQRALISWFLDKATENGYMEVMPPLLINEESGFGTGQLPDKEGQMYFVNQDNLYLIPTAEVPVTNIFRDTIINSNELPVKVTAYSPCFRREAGSYGKDVRGLNRLHQFDKVEIVQVAHPGESYKILELMKDYVAGLLEELHLPYRILKLCGGDMSFASALTYDMEVWSAAQKKWLEVSSVSNFETYQSNRLKLRFREEKGKPALAHTLNGSALALPRILASLLENNQTEQGIKIPEVLIPYTGFEIIN
jgi:seryl-tRNA synthetase